MSLNPINAIRAVAKAVRLQQDAVVPAPVVVAPVCEAADTLCQLNEYVKELGYDVPAIVEDKTGYSIPTHLPEFVQNGLNWLNDATDGYVTPIRASIAASTVGALFGMYATYKTLSALRSLISRDCPTEIRLVIENNEEMMKLFAALSDEAKVALTQMDQATAKTFFDGATRVNQGKSQVEAILQMDAATQVKLVAASLQKANKQFNQKTHNARLVKAAKLAADKKAAATPAVAQTVTPSKGYLATACGYVPSFRRGAAAVVAATAGETPTVEQSADNKPKI